MMARMVLFQLILSVLVAIQRPSLDRHPYKQASHTRDTTRFSPIHALVDSTHSALKDGGLRMDND